LGSHLIHILGIHILSRSLGMKDSWGPLKALAAASIINGIGDIILCRYLNYGIAGAAWATLASQVCRTNLYALRCKQVIRVVGKYYVNIGHYFSHPMSFLRALFGF